MPEPFKNSQDEKEAERVTQTEAIPSGNDTVLSLAGETEEYIHDDEPGRIISSTSTEITRE